MNEPTRHEPQAGHGNTVVSQQKLLPPIIAELSEHRSGDKVQRTISFQSVDGKRQELWWRIAGARNALPAPLTREDIIVTSLVFHAMHTKRNLHVRGRVSESVLDNMEVFQQIWALWRPDIYTKIEISADVRVSEHRPAGRDKTGICAFSGGVDGTATAWRHHSHQAGQLNRQLIAGVLIRGFDIALDDDAGWSEAERTAALALSDIDLPLVRVETNWRDQFCGDWEMEHAAGVLGCLRHWEEDAGSLLLGSDEDYRRLVVPLGAHPLPTNLLGGGDTVIHCDGSAMTRTEKVALISEWPIGYDLLRVCWEGKNAGRNCGICEKCVRTKLNAIACGKPIPASLGARPTRKEIRSIKRVYGGQLRLMEEVLEVAKQNGIVDPLLGTLASTLAHNKARARLRALGRPLKSLARKVLNRPI
jgi:hypothetical protein